MKNINKPDSFHSFIAWATPLLVMACLACPFSAEATAPRISAQMFGVEKKAEIVGYQSAADAAATAEINMLSELVMEAFTAAGQSPALDVLPSRQLAQYALSNKDAAVLMGSSQDFAVKDKGQYRVVTFFLRGDTFEGEPVVLIFDKKNERANELHHAFSSGLKNILKSGNYLKIIEKYRGKENAPADIALRLKQHNPDWK